MGHDRRVFRSIILIGFLVFGLMRVADVAPAAANEVLKWNETAVKAAVTNTVDWLLQQNATNVLLEIGNEDKMA